MKKVLLALLLLVAAGAAWLILRPSPPPEVPFARVTRGTLVATLPTNGKVEPAQWRPVRAERGGVVTRVAVEEGMAVKAGALLAELRPEDAAGELASAQARVETARAELERLSQGGSAAERAELDNQEQNAEAARARAEREIAALRRLVEKNAATRAELEAAERQREQAQLELAAVRRKRAALIMPGERVAAEARLREAEAALAQARRRLSLTRVLAPAAGTVYALGVREGAYLQPGDLVANIGRLERLRVRVYVDEPEVGRVAVGQPVEIRWDALPGVTWKGGVERLPAEIVALGTRQVGQVICTIENTDGRLIPGVNVTAEIRTALVEGALLVPKETLRNERGQTGVYRLHGQTLEWRPVRTGTSSATHAEILDGLAEGDAVALPTEQPLAQGQPVKAVFP